MPGQWLIAMPAENLVNSLEKRSTEIQFRVLRYLLEYEDKGFGVLSAKKGLPAQLLRRSLKDIRKHIPKEDWDRAERCLKLHLMVFLVKAMKRLC